MMKALRLMLFFIMCGVLCYFILMNVRYFNSIDLLPPIIEMDTSEITISINDPITQVMDGVTASDVKDGDVTNLVVINNVSNFIEKDKRLVDYIAFDNDGNYSEAQRTLVYSDYTPMRFEIKNPLKFPIGTTDKEILDSFAVWDCLDGDISNTVQFDTNSMINSNVASQYKVNVNVENSAGETATLPVTVEIYNNLAQGIQPDIYLNKYLVYTHIDEKLNLLDYIDHVQYRGVNYAITDEEGTFGVDTSEWGRYEREMFKEREPAVNKDKVNITNYINYQVPGTYEVVYELSDLEDNTGHVVLTVVVENYE